MYVFASPILSKINVPIVIIIMNTPNPINIADNFDILVEYEKASKIKGRIKLLLLHNFTILYLVLDFVDPILEILAFIPVSFPSFFICPSKSKLLLLT